MHCDGVCDVYDWFEMPKTFCIVLEFIDGYDLFHITTEFGTLDEDLAKLGTHIFKTIIEILVKTGNFGKNWKFW